MLFKHEPLCFEGECERLGAGPAVVVLSSWLRLHIFLGSLVVKESYISPRAQVQACAGRCSGVAPLRYVRQDPRWLDAALQRAS